MVHTRHSYSKDIEDFTAINGHNNDDVVNGYEEDSIAQEQENTEILNENENNDRKDIEEKVFCVCVCVFKTSLKKGVRFGLI